MMGKAQGYDKEEESIGGHIVVRLKNGNRIEGT